jgi:O-antigen biosynthesis protein WbqP
MSLIGPRPALPAQTDLNAARQAGGVLALRPGITGWAQVCGRDDLSDAAKVTCDVYYRKNLSPRLDGLILLRTIGAVFTGRGSH